MQTDKDGENEKQDVTVPKQVVPKQIHEDRENEKQEEKPIDVTVPKQVVECTPQPAHITASDGQPNMQPQNVTPTRPASLTPQHNVQPQPLNVDLESYEHPILPGVHQDYNDPAGACRDSFVHDNVMEYSTYPAHFDRLHDVHAGPSMSSSSLPLPIMPGLQHVAMLVQSGRRQSYPPTHPPQMQRTLSDPLQRYRLSSPISGGSSDFVSVVVSSNTYTNNPFDSFIPSCTAPLKNRV